MENTKTGWEVLKASVSQRNGGLHIEGNNHESTDPLFQKFNWHIHWESLKDGRFDFSGCTFADGAQEVYQRLMARAAQK